MADIDNQASEDPEMDRLKAEIENLKAAIAERANDVNDAVRARAEAVRSNPGTHGAALLIGGAIGVLIGMALGQSERPKHHNWWER